MATVSVHALNAGSLTLHEKFFITPSDPEAKRRVPSLSFLIQHKDKGSDGQVSRIVFDLGMRRDLSLYPPPLQKHCEGRQPITTMPDVVTSLAEGDLGVEDIDYVMFSHVHYDHVGMPSDFNDSMTKFIVGPGALDLLNGKTVLDIGSHMVFEADLLPPSRTTELPSVNQKSNGKKSDRFSWQTLGPFPHAIDFFQDGSVYIINAPGHLPGHINLLCRVSTSPLKFVYLAGDACHDIRLLSGERDIATWEDDKGKYCCIHADVPAAKETLARIRELVKNGFEVPDSSGKAEVEVVFAHDWAWEEVAQRNGKFWPGSL